MDIDKVFPGGIITKRNIRSIELSYRRYGKLEATEKKIFDGIKNQYPPMVWKLALHIRFTLHKPLKERYFNIASRWLTKKGQNSKWGLLVKEYQHNGGIYCIYNASNKNYQELGNLLYNELIFEGFVPMNDYPKIVPHKLYISTNRATRDTKMIYPKAFVPYHDDVYGMYGIPGITSYKIY